MKPLTSIPDILRALVEPVLADEQTPYICGCLHLMRGSGYAEWDAARETANYLRNLGQGLGFCEFNEFPAGPQRQLARAHWLEAAAFFYEQGVQ
jgi:hypothetical protein